MVRRSPREVFDSSGTALLEIVCAHYWLQQVPFAYVDVGGQYGLHAIVMAQAFAACGRNEPIVVFEPGIAGNLLPVNLEINHVADRVVFETLAVADGCYPTLLFAESGHSENNRIVNRDPGQEVLSYVVHCTSLDEYVERKALSRDLVVKIDTQGGEVEVLEGIRRTRAEGLVTMVTEFTPWALATRVKPAEWLGALGETHVLAIPRQLPGLGALLKRLGLGSVGHATG